MKKSPITDRLDDIVKKSSKLIDSYQTYERKLSNLGSFARNYINDKFIREKQQEVLSIKEQFEVVSTDFKDFKDFKGEYRNGFGSLMQEYLDKYDEYLVTVMHSINKRIRLQDALLIKDRTLLGNISLIHDMKNTIDLCLKSGLEVNKIVVQMQKNI
ncbi:MAG: hypothetical protein GY862_00020 [Gammaproteobacteria bacterium]|nr:hypothetical protein [Gammaproteobacteria bacterium]